METSIRGAGKVRGASTAGDRAQTVAHGGDLDAARRQFPQAPEPWIDLSTGINPHAYPVPPLAAETWARLPLASAELALRRAAAERYGAAGPELLVSASGSQALIQVLPRLIESSDVAVLGPTYAEHAVAWRAQGHRVREVATFAELFSARVAVIVNPNNPTGRIVSTDDLRVFATELAARRGLLVVDEAFADLAEPGASIVPESPPATIVLRSFGKTYGLAGLRLGFAVAHEETAAKLRNLLGPWPVSGPALAIGAHALADAEWLVRMRATLAADCERLDAQLNAHGLSFEGGTLLFRLFSHPRVGDIADALGRDGILVRRFAEHPTWLRFGLPGSDEAWQRLEQSLRRVL